MKRYEELRKDGWGQFPTDLIQDITGLLSEHLDGLVEYLEWYETEPPSIFIQYKPKYGEGKAFQIFVEEAEREI